jgi:hypothetical protein
MQPMFSWVCLKDMYWDHYCSYSNDIKNLFRYSKLNILADDTLLYIAADTLDEAVNRSNDDLVSLSQWLT